MSNDAQDKYTVLTHGLPNEVMALIFSSITGPFYQCTLVNRAFYETMNPKLWQSVDLSKDVATSRFCNGMRDMAYQRCVTLGRLIHNLWLILNGPIIDDLSHLLSYMPNLKHLTLSGGFNNEEVRYLGRDCPRLSSVHLDKTRITSDGFHALAECPLEDFEWTFYSPESLVLLEHLVPCPLRRLCINSLTMFSSFDSQVRYIFTSTMIHPSTFPHLTVLELNWGPKINQLFLIGFLKNHPLLEQLHLSHQPTITDAMLDAIQLPRLTRATFKGLERITTDAVRRLINKCPLTYLDVSHCIKVDTAGFPPFVVKEDE